jgi:hypothetical protein
MVALASTDVTVTVNERRIYGTGKKRRNRVTLTYGDGAKTYPTGGVPMPAQGSFGMTRQLDYLSVIDQSVADGFVYKYDVTNKFKIFVEQAVGTNTPLAEATTALAPAATTIVCEAVGW